MKNKSKNNNTRNKNKKLNRGVDKYTPIHVIYIYMYIDICMYVCVCVYVIHKFVIVVIEKFLSLFLARCLVARGPAKVTCKDRWSWQTD